MKIISLIIIFMIFLASQLKGNNIQVTNTQLVSQNTVDDFVMVEFNITWENSWRLAGGPANWDAAWIFVKYRVGAGPWTHAYLHNTGHETCQGMITSNGLLTPGAPFDPSTNPALGVFLYRSEPGAGNIVCQEVRLRWNYGANLLNDNTVVDVKVFAIEHVYIPAGPFKVGSGGTENGALYTYPTPTDPYLINSEAAITVGTSNGNLYYQSSFGLSGDQQGPIPAAYPKGTQAYYAMKYEISQQGYIEFLNTLTRQQQATRVRANISGTSVTNRFVMSNTSSPSYRNGVSCRSTIPASPGIVEFGSDLDNNNVENGSQDGQSIVCNFLLWMDLIAYLDWASLRLMSELEFEKCARGPATPVANEYVWGNNTINFIVNVNNSGTVSEIPSTTYANSTGAPYNNPTRCGIFARSNNDRTTSGAGYYGNLDLGGNVMERGATIGYPEGRAFTGAHGNGMLTVDGNSDVSNWPGLNSVGIYGRGGGFYGNYADNRTSDRNVTVQINPPGELAGGRGVRSAP